MGFVSKLASATLLRVTGRTDCTTAVRVKERYVCSQDKIPNLGEKNISKSTHSKPPTPVLAQHAQPPPPPTLPSPLVTPCCNKECWVTDVIKNNWKYLVVLVLLSAALSLIASSLLRDRGVAIMPIFIYPGFMLSGCSFLIGSQKRGKPSSTTENSLLTPTIKPEEQKKDQLVVKSERSIKAIDASILLLPPKLLGQVVAGNEQQAQLQPSEKTITDELVAKLDRNMNSLNINESSASIAAAPAPPPPPPPPSPAQSFTELIVDCRKLSWDVVGRDSLDKGTVWNKMSKPLKVEEIVDIRELGLLFGLTAPPLTTKAIKKLAAKPTIMGTKKKLNISISLAHSKLPSQTVIDGLLSGKADLTTDLLENLLKFAPNDIEESALKKQGKKDSSVFSDVEMLFHKIITKIPTYKERIRTMLLKAQLRERMNYIQPYLQTIIAASKEVRENDILRQFLLFVLTVGNFMNKSKTRGFKLSFLSKLIGIKSNIDKTKTFLDFVVKNFKSLHPEIVDITKQMKEVNAAAKINFKHLVCEVDELSEELQLLENDVKMINKSKGLDKTFKDNIKKFVAHAQKEFQSLVELKNIALSSYNETLLYFGEDHAKSVLSEQFFGNIRTFLAHLEKSLKMQQ